MEENKKKQPIQYVHVPETDDILVCKTYSGKELFWKELNTIVDDGLKADKEK
jgi:hypothetical protein